MLKSHAKFHSANGKRLILVADDEFINREILRSILEEEYELIFAEDGRQTLEMMRQYKESLSLVLLDIMMPVMSGMDVLREAKVDPEISQIPIIVVTSDQDAEVESLTIGAIDFIPKPYPQVGVILARVLRTIELSEDRQIISSTERDELTGLYNREYFYRYAEQFDHHHKEMEMDAIVIDVNHFHMINERFGTAYGDKVLKHIAESLREMVSNIGGITCRREADTFLVYCPNGQDYAVLLETASIGLNGEGADDSRVWLRMGVYANVDKDLEIERRFDRAKMAADTVQGSFTRKIAVYDSTLHEKELYAEQLIEDFNTAIKERQFQVYYQPKFDVRPEIPVLASAEALVRWMHPKLGMISPGVFIPLFEENGLIQRLDLYVWREAAAKIREWRDRFDFVVPVSVNVSRIDMYDPHLVDTLLSILEGNDLSTSEFLLEITESAYTQDSEQIIETVNSLRSLGFRVEMDDFGTGYSSLNMISTLPIDTLKLDMQFIRNAFAENGDMRMLEVIIDIADYLSVPVIAEGVETEEQLLALKEIGCDYVQGYYFSRPVPADEYEDFVAARSQQLKGESIEAARLKGDSSRKRESAYGEIAHALTNGFEVIYYVDTESNHYVEFSSEGKHENLQIENSGLNFFDDTIKHIVDSVWPEDKTRIQLTLQKPALLAQLAGSQAFVVTYRMAVDDKPVFYSLKAVRAHTHDDHHIVIGLSNVDSQFKQVEGAATINEPNFGGLARALSADMESIYYIDVNSGTYLEFNGDGSYRDLELEVGGIDFFGDCQKNLKEVVYYDDRDKVARALSRDKLIGTLNDHDVFTMVYRLTIDGHPQYYHMKAVWADERDRNHVIIGVSNVDSQVSDEDRLEDHQRSRVTYESIVQALVADYFSIYYVNTVNDNFIEYSSSEQYQQLAIEKSGVDFFRQSRENVKRVLHSDDLEMFLTAFTKEKVLEALQRDRTFTLTYRLMFSGVPTYVHMKATRMKDETDNHIVIGLSNVDDQIRREHEYAQALRMANHDALTGVKSRHAYSDEERRIDFAIVEKRQVPFSVVVCDVNGLKSINDRRGSGAGDQHIKDACAVICAAFKHSPVYRIGGDEFAVILRGRDYEERESLMENLRKDACRNNGDCDSLVTGGIADYRPGIDMTCDVVFERANEAMRENKRALKQQVASGE